MSMLQEFKAFAMRGNVMDLAIAVIIGGAFGKIISALVDKIMMPLIGILMGGVDFKTLSMTVGDAKILYGEFIQATVDFTIIAFVLFMVIKVMNSRKAPEAPAAPAEPPAQEKRLAEIRDLLKK